MAILMFVVGGVLALGGIVTVLAGGIAAGEDRNDLAVAGFVAGGSGMILSGATAVVVGYLLYPVEKEPPAAAFGPSLKVRF
jgi:hypothetical protein